MERPRTSRRAGGGWPCPPRPVRRTPHVHSHSGAWSPQVVLAAVPDGPQGRAASGIPCLLTHPTSLVNFLTNFTVLACRDPQKPVPGLPYLFNCRGPTRGSPAVAVTCATTKEDPCRTPRLTRSVSTWAAPRRICAPSRAAGSSSTVSAAVRGWRPHDPGPAADWLAALVARRPAGRHAPVRRRRGRSRLRDTTPVRRDPGRASGRGWGCPRWSWAMPSCSSRPRGWRRASVWSPAPVRSRWGDCPAATRSRSAAGVRHSATRAARPASSARPRGPSGRPMTAARIPTRWQPGWSPRSVWPRCPRSARRWRPPRTSPPSGAGTPPWCSPPPRRARRSPGP